MANDVYCPVVRGSRNNDYSQNVTRQSSIKIFKPMIVGYMSTDVSREFHHDLSQLKYITKIPEGRLHFDLNHNIDKAIKRTTNENNEKITLLLKFIVHQKDRLKPILAENLTFITYRRTLINVMCNIFIPSPVTVVASLFNNCIYLCCLESQEELLRQKSNRELHKFCAWGYKFEQFMSSDKPNLEPDTEKPVIENEEFSLCYYAELRHHKLFYGAQIDGMLAVDTPNKEVPDTDDVEKNLTFLRENSYVELKTQKNLYNKSQETSFKRYKLLKCWCQCFLADLKGLLVGYRDDDGIIQGVEWFYTPGIVRYCREIWTPQRTVDYLDNFLNFVKKTFCSMRINEELENNTKTPLTLKFDIDERHQFHVTRTDAEEHIILPIWYIDSFEGSK